MPRKLSAEHRSKLSALAKRKRKPLTQEHRDKIALAMSCRPKTKAQLESASLAMRLLWSERRTEMIRAQKRGRKNTK